MPGLQRTAEIDHDKGQAHDQCTDRDPFADDDHPVKIGVMKDVGWQDKHDRRRRDTDQEGEVGDIESPADDIVHAGYRQTVAGLKGIGIDAKPHTAEQDDPEQLKTEAASQVPADDVGQEGCQDFSREAVRMNYHLSINEIPEFWVGPEFFLHPEDLFVLQDITYLAVRIEQVAEHPRPGRTGLDTGGQPAFPGPLDTEGAFFHFSLGSDAVAEVMLFDGNLILGHLRLAPVEPAAVVGTGGLAVAAADTPVVVDHHDAVRFPPGCPGRAGLGAGRFFAVKALGAHVELVVHRDLVIILAVAGARVELSGLHLKNPDILGVGFAVQIVLLDAGG